MTTSKQTAIDANILVALVDSRDKWHASARAIRDALKVTEANLVYFDSVVNETISVLARRAQEQGRIHQFPTLMDALMHQVPVEIITWLSSETQRLYSQVIELVRNTSGRLNFHDALIALGCRELGIDAIVSFDEDFDQVAWLTRIQAPDDLLSDLEDGD